MKPGSKIQFLCAAAVSFFLVNAVNIQVAPTGKKVTLNIGQEALAKRGGGRSGGGSFNRSSPSRSSSPYRSNRSSDSDYGGGSGYSSGTNVYIVPGGSSYGYYYYSPLPIIVLVLILGIFALALLLAIKTAIRSSKNSIASGAVGNDSSGNSELDNNIVTVSQIQVGLLAQARAVQKQLTEFSLNADTETPEGLAELLQESALALLRTPENWTHVSASSKTVRCREEAQTIFNQISVEERTKFSAETLTNVKGKVRQIQQYSQPNEEPGRHIVVTLLIGTENDRPLFGNVFSTKELKQALERIAATPPEYLSAFELLWTPQSETESLTYDEMLTEYSNMMQIA